MLSDEELARALQEEEVQIARFALQQDSGGQQQVKNRIQHALATVSRCEDEMNQAIALSMVPVDELDVEAERWLSEQHASGCHAPASPWDRQDALAHTLLHWFKHKFFQWVNAPPCDLCSCHRTQCMGQAAPSDEDAQHGASRVEVYRCERCGNITRFPRYNDPAKLLDTRRGRCGEWASAFLLFCRAVGLPARYVVDFTDHVWTEVYSHSQGRWLHMDSCEAAFDSPLLYESGWGKKLTYVVAVGAHDCVDVTRRYTRAWPDVLQRRTLVSEAFIDTHTRAVRDSLRGGLARDTLAELHQRDEQERQELHGVAEAIALADSVLPGRTTGTREWREARGELGKQPDMDT